jgi:hypothetical protein
MWFEGGIGEEFTGRDQALEVPAYATRTTKCASLCNICTVRVELLRHKPLYNQ